MLRNREQRLEYLESDSNWELLDVMISDNQELFRLYKLKDLNIYKIAAHYGATTYMPEHWGLYETLFCLSEDGLYKSYLNRQEALEVIRKA